MTDTSYDYTLEKRQRLIKYDIISHRKKERLLNDTRTTE